MVNSISSTNPSSWSDQRLGQIKDFPPNILGGASLHHKQLGAFLSISWLPFFSTAIRGFYSYSAKLGQQNAEAPRLRLIATVVTTWCRSHICCWWGTSPVHLSSRRNWSARKSLPVVCWLSPAPLFAPESPPWSCLQKIWEKQPTHNLQWPDWILSSIGLLPQERRAPVDTEENHQLSNNCQKSSHCEFWGEIQSPVE